MAALKITGRDPIGAARDILEAAGIEIVEEREMPHGVQFRLDGGRIVNVYSTGSIVAQGARSDTVQRVFEDAIRSGGDTPARTPVPPPPPRTTTTTALAPRLTSTTSTEFASRRHPQWTETVWDGVTPPFALD